jgi:hypothetical protein
MYFKQNMEAMGFSAPKELFGTLEKTLGPVYAISKAIETFGTRVTVIELIGAVTLAEGLGITLILAQHSIWVQCQEVLPMQRDDQSLAELLLPM